jgi:CheY-like chemotaxis protein
VVEVSDNGCGIRREMLSTIFEPFVQAERTLDRARGGIGLGLALVKALAELHGGSVSARSDGPGRGSTFTVRLAAFDAPARARVECNRVAAAGRIGARPKRVLVVDDNQDAADTLALALEGAGHRVEVAYDGPEALMRAKRAPPDVALLDIGLPVMDGYELAARLRKDREGDALSLVALTGYGQESDIERSRTAGFDVHLVKPVDVDTILRVIASLDPRYGPYDGDPTVMTAPT